MLLPLLLLLLPWLLSLLLPSFITGGAPSPLPFSSNRRTPALRLSWLLLSLLPPLPLPLVCSLLLLS
jgi:hypothetical protein